MILGLIAAVGTAILTNLGLVAQKDALDARAPGKSIFSAFIRPRWIGGFMMIQIGWLLQLVALRQAPLYVVQPIVASGLLVLAAAARIRLNEPIGGREWLAISAVAVGAVLLSLTAAASGVSGEGSASATSAAMALMVAVFLAGGLATAARILRHKNPSDTEQKPALLMALAAGVAYSVTVVLSKPISARFDADLASSLVDVATHAEIYLLAAFSLAALLANQQALAEGRAVTVVPAVVVTMTLIPVGAGVILFGEQVPPGMAGIILIAATTLCVAGVAALARIPVVARLAGDDENT